MFSGYRDDEVVMGFPLDDFVRVAESTEEKEITSALCGCIMDDIPQGAVSAIEKIGFGREQTSSSGASQLRSCVCTPRKIRTERSHP